MVELKQENVRWDTYRSAAYGGLALSKAEAAVKLTHIPTGTCVEVNASRSQHQNREKALEELKKLLLIKHLLKDTVC